MRTRRLVGAVALAGTLVAGCTSTDAHGTDGHGDAGADGVGPAAAIARFAHDWAAGRTHDASELTDDPAAAAQLMTTVTGDLRASALEISTGRVDRTGDDTASVTATMTWSLADVGDWSYTTDWQWSRHGAGGAADWLLDYAPTMVHPDLGPQQTLAVRTIDATDGPIVDRHDAELISPVRVYSVVVLTDEVTDAAATAHAVADGLAPLDVAVSAKQIAAGIASAAKADEASYTVINLRADDFDRVQSSLAKIGALSLPSTMRDLPPTPGFARQVLDQALPVAQDMAKGRAGWRIVTVDAAGDELKTVSDHPAVPGAKVTFTLDPAVQQAAAHAIADIPEPAVLVAIQPASGDILAVAQNDAANAQGPIALTGQYPPGSTFKIATATAAIDAGEITPDTEVDCPGSWTVTKGQTIHNEGFALGTVTATTAFAHSCNTTFAKLGAELPAGALPAAAREYGIGLDFDIPGVVTLTGKIQRTDSYLSRAQNGFGQGTDLVTPFSAALMAATAATGNMPTPTLIRGTTTTVDHPAPPRSKAARSGVRAMMRAVVTEGTARSLRDDGTVYAKTGTAEYVAGDGKIQAHAWTVGFRGDVAFSALIVGGNSSKRTNEVVHRFLAGLPAD